MERSKQLASVTLVLAARSSDLGSMMIQSEIERLPCWEALKLVLPLTDTSEVLAAYK